MNLKKLLFAAGICLAAGLTQPAQAALDSNSTVFIIMMENHNWSSILGSASAPYINNTLLPQASYCDQYFNPSANHPSEPNYLWLEAGTNFGINNDNPPSSNQQATTAHFVTQLQNAGISWKSYQEGITGTTCPTTDNTGAGYYVKHNPMAFFTDVTGAANPTCTSVMRPFSELASDLVNNNVAHYNFLTPSICNDMHDTCAPTNDSIKQGDNWLAANLPGILASSAYQNNGLVIITWDEGAGTSDGPIGCIVLSPLAKGGGYHNAIRYTHGSTLRTMQKIFGVSPFLGGAKLGPDLGDLFVAGAIPNADPTPLVANNVEATGIVVVEAENFDANIPRSGKEWDFGSSVAGYSGTGYMEGLPNSGTEFTSAGITSPELQYLINFTSTGTHYVWIKGHAPANTDDSAFVGIDGGSAVSMTLSTVNAWQWSNAVTTGTNQIPVGTTGNHTISVWMREDGLRLDRILITTNATFSPTLGNAWHIPTSTEGGILNGGQTMRNPTSVTLGTPVTIYNGNQFQGGGGQGNQLTTGSTVFYKRSTDSTWSSVPMAFLLQNGNNKYFSTSVPTSGFAAGDVIQYYLRIPYSDHLPTFLYGSDSQSNTTEFESFAQTHPFTFNIKAALTPPNGASFHSINSASGTFQGRIYDDTGHLALAEPDLNGNPLANIITFAPPSATIGGVSYGFGKVLSVTNITNGIQVTQSLAGTTVTAQLTFTTDGIMHYEVTDWNGLAPTETDVTCASDVTEHVYGFGEKFNALDQSGNRVHIMASDMGGDKNDFSYKSSSWFLSTRGYGFHLDSTAESFFDMRNSAADRYTVQNLFGKLKFNVVAGPKLTDALSRYTGLVGRPYLPPPWVFGTWVSSDIWRTGGEVRYAITKYQASGIPISAFVFDSPWEVSYNDFIWNMSQWGAGGTYEGTNYNGFASVNEMMTFFQQHGVKVVLWFTPFINTSSFNDSVNGHNIPGQNTGKSPNYDFAASNNYFVRSSAGGSPLTVGWWKGTGSPVDFTNPAAKNWFLTTQLQPLLTQSNVTTANASPEPAIGGFKTDDGEAINSGPPYIPTTAVYSDGRTGLEMQNGYCVEYHKTVSSLLGANGILFARSGFNGTGAYPGGWPGDNQPNYTQTNGLQSVITAGDSAAMSGFAIWGNDIGGYQNANFTSDHADLFMRWTQYGAFCPIMQMHRGVQASDLTDTSNLEQYPWGYGATALSNYVTYAKLHSQLFPYIYTYAKEASVDGLPLIRPLVLLNPADTTIQAVQHTFYFGNELLVAPMNTADSTTRNVQLPAGNWYDYWTNTKYTGEQTLAWSNSDTTKIPLFVKEGSIIPMLINVPQTLCDANYVNNPGISMMDTGLQFLIYPGANIASFTLYDGTSAQCAVLGTVTKINFMTGPRQTSLKVFETAAPAGVERNGQRLPNVQTQAVFDSPSTTVGWYYDAATQFVRIKFQRTQGTVGNEEIDFGPDSVGDGVPDSWRSFYGITDDTADSDGDGLTNRQEYFAGTNPNDAGSTFNIQAVTPNSGGPGFVVSWLSQLNIPYQVQWKHALSDLNWTVVNQAFSGTGQVMMFTDDGSQTASFPDGERFYRVVIP